MIRVLVVEELRLVRAAMCSLLARQDDLVVVGAIGTDPGALPPVAAMGAEVALVDIDAEGGHALAVAEGLRGHSPDAAILMLTGRPTPGRLHRALAIRPHGLLAKTSSTETLVEGVRRVSRGERVIEPDFAVAALQCHDNPLTRRELDVLRLAAEGVPVTEMADRLYLSAGTVRNYLSSAISKTQARNRIDAIRVARQFGWL